MPRAATRDLATAGAVVLFAGAYLYLGRGLEAGVVNGVPGPGAFPRLLGLGMLACAAILALRGLGAALGARHGGPAAAVATPAAASTSASTPVPERGRVAALYAVFVLYVLVMPYAGFQVATFVFAVTAMAAILRLGVRASVVYAGALTLFAWGLFRLLLDVPLPAGRFG